MQNQIANLQDRQTSLMLFLQGYKSVKPGDCKIHFVTLKVVLFGVIFIKVELTVLYPVIY